MSRVSLEEHAELPDEVVPTETLDDVMLETEDTAEKSENVTQDIEVIGELAGTATALEAIVDAINAHGIKDKGSLVYVHQAIQARLSRLGLEHLYIVPSFENYDNVSQEAIVASLENIISKIWNSVINMGSKAWKEMTDFFKDFTEDVYDIASKAEALQRDLDKRETTTLVKQVEISQAHYLHLSGRTDKDAIIKGFDNLCKVNKTSFPKYIDNVKKFYDQYFKAMQEIAGLGKTWFEDITTRAKVVDNFLKSVSKDLNLTLDTDDGSLEFSGGRIFRTRNIVVDNLPEVLRKQPNLSVDSRQTIEVMTKAEIEHVLKQIISNADVIKSFWKRWNDMLEVLSKARTDAAEDSANIDQWRILKLLSRVDTHMGMAMSHGAIMQPLNVLAWHTLHVSRSLLRVCERNIHLYRPKI